MANVTDADAEFGGDELSNNLFSDLAPLLTLFGEQVTKQFLSMSMGWADNVLLGMGPLGVITIIVSAIRVGGVRQLKALVGRARESRSTAELELLSSTSPDVCELWSGKEVVRTLGSPAGMKTMIIARSDDGTMQALNLGNAFKAGLLTSRGLDGRGPDWKRKLEQLLEELSEAAPNLALNVKNATAPSREVWLWASVGVILQGLAIVIPGFFTHRWGWEKGGLPVPHYGYPCFLVGTLLLILGVVSCGRVVEGITTEHYFHGKKGPQLQGPEGNLSIEHIVRLQHSCTASDQHFSSFAIYNSKDNLEVRVSQLNKPGEQSYSTLAAAATLISVAGFIIQFIGLRALHWSATVIQLGVTLIMTGIRAYMRRSLATNPIALPLLERHESAALTMRLLQDRDMSAQLIPPAPALKDSPNSPLALCWQWLFTQRSQHELPVENTDDRPPVCIWEVPTLRHSSRYSFHIPEERQNRAPRAGGGLETLQQYRRVYADMLLAPLELAHPLSTEIPVEDLGNEPALCSQIQALGSPHGHEVIALSHKLAMAIEMLVIRFQESRDVEFKISARMEEPSFFQWRIPVVSQTLWKNRQMATVQIGVKKEFNDREIPEPAAWRVESREMLKGVLSLWMCTLAQRTDLLDGRPDLRPQLGLARPPNEDVDWSTPRVWLRVVGHTLDDAGKERLYSNHGSWEDRALLGRYLSQSISTTPSHLGVLGYNKERGNNGSFYYEGTGKDLPIFGACLSCLSSCARETTFREWGWDHYVVMRHQTGLAMQCAQEILSIFILTIASEVQRVGGKTVRRRPQATPDETRTWGTMENSVFRELAQTILDADMAHDIDDAYTLVIPAFAHYNLLPTEPTAPGTVADADDENEMADDEGVVGLAAK
ncbi:hypothetical protein QBC34DRAFT_362061 [Podospora aff. communis PSN243]|uniref:Uncharacterized protein n=1 Tax=Podospora aff. communis PSN243 TaxID=3040156 RepID=A0AAV9G5G1_9PEZI|nr:hypothetical protein QBC34DRAFT_362061 [Podospora aff. communis PSN243]